MVKEDALMSTLFGSGSHIYQVDANWGRGPKFPAFGLVSGVACDSRDQVYVLQREPEPTMLVFSSSGEFLHSWGSETLSFAHGVWIGPDDTVYCTDRKHTVTRWNVDGTLLETWGTPHQPGEPGQPFNEPARAVQSPQGDVFVADGYGQYRTHRFAIDGELKCSWGTAGTGPGEFGWPVHSVWVDPRGRLLVTDRGNNRVQHFTLDGNYLGEWCGLGAPNDLCIDAEEVVYIAEGGPSTTSRGPIQADRGPGITIMSLDGDIIVQWGERGDQPGQFAASPHCLWVDSSRDIYIGEVITHNRLQKFVRQC